MRIELPAPSWASAHRAQDDAHTLTLAAERVPPLAAFQLPGEPPPPSHVTALAGERPPTLTLTF